GRVIQTFLQWNYTHFNENCTTASGRTFCKDIRICKFAAASLVMGGWPTMCGWVDNVVPKVCCGFPLVLGGALLRKVDEEKARKRECGKTLWSPGLSETENNFFKLVHDLPDVNTSDPTRFDPPIDFSIQTMVSPVGGVSSRQGDFPWMVSIRKNGKHLCGGSLIDRSHVLSAAHCFDSRDLSEDDRIDGQCLQKLFVNIIESFAGQFVARFAEFVELEETSKFIASGVRYTGYQL
ncbi:hypothetical protein AVEN_22373-1, partial [Araneus ventricosus]